MKLFKAMIKKLDEDFPSLEFSINNEEKHIIIPPLYNDFGDLVIQDEDYELTIYLGNFTHFHIGDFEEPINENKIILEASEFISDIFSNKIVMWGSNEKSGGFYYMNENPNLESSQTENHKQYTWSGPKIS